MASTSFSEGIKNFFKSVNKDGTKEMTFANSSTSVNEQKTLSNKTSSDVYILLNSNQCQLNIGGRGLFFNSQVKSDPDDEVVVVDSDSDSESPPVNNLNKVSAPYEPINTADQIQPECVTPIQSKYLPNQQSSNGVIPTPVVDNNLTFVDNTDYVYPTQEYSESLLPVHSIFVPEKHCLEESEEDNRMDEEDCEEIDVSLCQNCGKPVSEVTSNDRNDICFCSYSSTFGNVQEMSELVSNIEGTNNENSLQMCKKKNCGNFRNHSEFHCTAIETSRLLCNICSNSFAGPGGLVKHVKEVHGTTINVQDALQSERIKNPLNSKQVTKPNLIKETAKHFGNKKSNNKFSSEIPKDVLPTSDMVYDTKSQESVYSNNLNSTKIVLNASLKKINICPFCKKLFIKKKALLRHCDFHCRATETFKLVCEICSNTFSGPKSLMVHVQRQHKIMLSFQKAVNAKKVKADKKFDNGCRSNIVHNNSEENKNKDNSNYDSHAPSETSKISEESKEIPTCTPCKKTFASLLMLQKHCDFHCPNRDTFKLLCYICKNAFAGSYGLQLHLHNVHKISISHAQAVSAKRVKSSEIAVDGNHKSHKKSDLQKSRGKLNPQKSHDNSVPQKSHGKLDPQKSHDNSVPQKSNEESIPQKSHDRADHQKSNEEIGKSNFQMSLNSNKSLYCLYCQKQFNQIQMFEFHCDFHCPSRDTFRLLCKLCSKSYAGPVGLKSHMNNVHNIAVSISEATCYQRIKSVEILRNDKIRLSGNEKTVELYKESKSPDSSSFNMSLRTRAMKTSPNTDDYVGTHLHLQGYNECHDENVKGEDERSVLKQLGHQNAQKRQHIKTKHSVRNLRATKLLKFFRKSGFSSSSSSVCPICGKYVYSSSFLKIHMRKHTNEKPFCCKKCGRKFFTKVAMKYHVTDKCPKRKVVNKISSKQKLLQMDESTRSPERDRRASFKKAALKNLEYSFTEESDFEINSDDSNDNRSTKKSKSPNNSEQSSSDSKSLSAKIKENLQSKKSSHEAGSRNKSPKETIYKEKLKFFKCDHCIKFFPSERSLHAHKNFRCPGKKHQSPRKLQDLVKIAHASFECRTCGKKCKNKQFLFDHESMHKREKRHCCENCNKRFQHFHIYRKHILLCKVKFQESHSEKEGGTRTVSSDGNWKNSNCGLCRRSSVGPCQWHRKASVSNVTSEKTTKASEVTSIILESPKKSKLKTSQLILICRTCNKEFNFPSAIKAHAMITHGKFDVICKLCNCRFNNFDGLTSHLKVNVRKYYCPKFENSEPDNQEKIDSTSDFDANTVSDDDNVFSCNACTNRYPSIVLLIQHLQDHMTKE